MTLVTLQIVASLTDESRGIICNYLRCLQYRHHLWQSSNENCNMLIVQAKAGTGYLATLETYLGSLGISTNNTLKQSYLLSRGPRSQGKYIHWFWQNYANVMDVNLSKLLWCINSKAALWTSESYWKFFINRKLRQRLLSKVQKQMNSLEIFN